MIARSRLIYASLVLLTIIIGLISREVSSIPLWIGDALWALMIFWGVAMLSPRLKLIPLTIVSILVCYAVETTQLYQADWINAIRRTLPGRLILGQGFLWSDLVAYAAGVISGAFLKLLFLNNIDK